MDLVPLKLVTIVAEHGGWGFTLEPLLLALLLFSLGLFWGVK